MLSAHKCPRYVHKRLVFVMTAGIHLRQLEGQAQAYLTQGTEVEADQGCHSTWLCSNLVDGYYENLAHSTIGTSGPHWMKIKMPHEYEVGTILVQNRDGGNAA